MKRLALDEVNPHGPPGAHTARDSDFASRLAEEERTNLDHSVTHQVIRGEVLLLPHDAVDAEHNCREFGSGDGVASDREAARIVGETYLYRRERLDGHLPHGLLSYRRQIERRDGRAVRRVNCSGGECGQCKNGNGSDESLHDGWL